MPERRVLLARIGRPHGVRGQVKLTSFTEDPCAIASYAPLYDERGREWRLRHVIGQTNPLLATIEGVTDRDTALGLTNLGLHIDRDALPAPDEDEFYLADLEGLAATDQAGLSLGRVAAVHDYGGGAWLELRDERGSERLIPFTRAAVPLVDLSGGRITIAPPDEIEVRDEDAA